MPNPRQETTHCVRLHSPPDAIRAGRLPASRRPGRRANAAPDLTSTRWMITMSKASQATTTAVPANAPGLSPTSCRRLLAGSGLGVALATIGLPAAAAFVHGSGLAGASLASHPDAALLAACTVFMATRDALYAVPDSEPDSEHDAALDRYHQACGAVDSIQPQSLTGLKAKVRVAIDGFEMGAAPTIGSAVEDSLEWHELGVWRLMHDVLLLGSTVA